MNNDIISGALVMGYAVIGLYFLRFWRQTHDRLFILFAVSFWVLALQRLALALSVNAAGSEEKAEGQLVFYCIRLLAFLLILVAIVDKNRKRKREL